MRLFALALILALVPVAQTAHAQCGEPGAQLQVFVKGKTAIRRGPGLNYPVSAFVEDGRCMKANDISIDGNWVMIEDPTSKGIGWVPTKQLDPASVEMLSTTRPKKGAAPVGSGQERGYLTTLRPVGLLLEPKRGAKEKRTLPAAARVLALAITDDRQWVQVRNERNESGWVMASDLEDTTNTIASLPVADNGLKTGAGPITSASADGPAPGGGRGDEPAGGSSGGAPPPPPKKAIVADADEGPRSPPPASSPGDEGGVRFQLHAMGMFALPRHGLESKHGADSEGLAGIRNYAVRANGGGAYLELRASGVGPVTARVSYGLVVVGGLAAEGRNPSDVVSGQQHDMKLLFGVPLTLGPLQLVPEFGYSGQIFAMTPALKELDEPTFLSHHSHLGTLGLRVGLDIAGYVFLDVEGHGLFGVTTEYPFDLGESGLTGGWRLGANAEYAMSPTFGIVARWELRSVKAPFTGPAPLDPAISTSRLVHAENQFSAGVMFRF